MPKAWVAIFLLGLVWSGYQPKDAFTWVLEVTPALVALVLLAVTRRRFPLTGLLYRLILVHCLILMVGGHYSYAQVPLFDWLRDTLGQDRNNYDKLSHLAQGFVPAMVTREILVRRRVVTGRGWLSFPVVCTALAISAVYELIEWWVALGSGASAEAFLGTQGYWDTQSDMLMALSGAVLALLLLSRYHDRAMAKLAWREEPGK